MNKFETVCFIIGCIGIVWSADMDGSILPKSIAKIITSLIFGAMIVLPLYFNFWR